MPRILAIDYGTKRTGIAVTDDAQIIATGLETVATGGLMAYLKDYTAKNNVEAFVVGMPKRTNNTATHNTAIVQDFIKFLKRSFPQTPVHEVDERFTSVIAFNTMIQAGLSKKARAEKGTVDKLSAVIILQSFMEQQAFAKSRQQL